MKPEELRISNYVDTGRGYAQIHCFAYTEVRVYLNPTGKQPRRFGFLISELKPIQLTKEWLVKFGFEYDEGEIQQGNNLFLQCNARINIVYADGDKNCVSIYQDGKLIDLAHGIVKYVHQLQNLYFALTGKELTTNK